MGKKLFVIVFLTILYLPLSLSLIAKYSVYSCDVLLNGYTDAAAKPELSGKTFWDGSFQAEFANWYEENLKPRGVLTKTYNTIQYNCFGLGNRPIGKHNDIFDISCINDRLCINGWPDYSDEEHYQEMRGFVNKLQILQEKLAEFDKYLYVYIAPNKADFHYENVPDKYKAIASSSAIRAVDAFRELIAKTNVPYLICSDVKDQLQYPAFYTTGVHWSRTFGQCNCIYQGNAHSLHERCGKFQRHNEFTVCFLHSGRDCPFYSSFKTERKDKHISSGRASIRCVCDCPVCACGMLHDW